MDRPLDELYLEWLYEQVAVSSFDDRDLTYWKLFSILYKTEFVWLDHVPNDENRVHDGVALRIRFIEEEHIEKDDVDPDWWDLGCSVLELIVSLAMRVEFNTAKGKTHYWFWILLENIGLSGYSDVRRFTKNQVARIESILDDLIYRKYKSNGDGGFFPLESPQYDQRNREIWYQMSDYIWEKNLAG